MGINLFDGDRWAAVVSGRGEELPGSPGSGIIGLLLLDSDKQGLGQHCASSIRSSAPDWVSSAVDKLRLGANARSVAVALNLRLGAAPISVTKLNLRLGAAVISVAKLNLRLEAAAAAAIAPLPLNRLLAEAPLLSQCPDDDEDRAGLNVRLMGCESAAVILADCGPIVASDEVAVTSLAARTCGNLGCGAPRGHDFWFSLIKTSSLATLSSRAAMSVLFV